MTDEQFSDCLEYHWAAFPALEQQLKKLGVESARNINRRWKKELDRFGETKVQRATEEMNRANFDKPGLTAHLQELRRLCTRFDSEETKSSNAPTLRNEPTDEDRYEARGVLRDAMRVLKRCKAMTHERVAAGFGFQDRRWQYDWGTRLNESVASVSHIYEREQYADAVLEAVEAQHTACMKELSRGGVDSDTLNHHAESVVNEKHFAVPYDSYGPQCVDDDNSADGRTINGSIGNAPEQAPGSQVGATPARGMTQAESEAIDAERKALEGQDDIPF